MGKRIDRKRRLLEIQGFMELDDAEVLRVEPWLRLAPAVCMAWCLAATAAGSVPGLLALAVIAVLGAVLRVHPFDLVHEGAVRRLRGTGPLPTYPLPRRLACAVASLWLVATAGLFAAGHAMGGTVMGSIMVAMAAVPTFTGLCLPSYLYRLIRGWPEKDEAAPRVASRRA